MDEKIAKAVDVLAKATGIFSALGRESCTMEEKEFFSEYVPRLEEMLQEQLLFYCETLRHQIDYLTRYDLRDLIKDQTWRNVWKKSFEEDLDGKERLMLFQNHFSQSLKKKSRHRS